MLLFSFMWRNPHPKITANRFHSGDDTIEEKPQTQFSTSGRKASQLPSSKVWAERWQQAELELHWWWSGQWKSHYWEMPLTWTSVARLTPKELSPGTVKRYTTLHVLAQQKPVLLSLSFTACHFTMWSAMILKIRGRANFTNATAKFS